MSEHAPFEEFQKIARLSRGCVITEKIDGTNAQVCIVPGDDIEIGDPLLPYVIAGDRERGQFMLAGSRSRYITPAADNFGFAAWVKAHADELWALGEGRHYGEWWGSGIQRGYGLQKGEKRWSLFNVAHWDERFRDPLKYPTPRPECCSVVPVLHSCAHDGCRFDTAHVDRALDMLRQEGSVAAPGFMKPEGVVVWHEAARVLFKKTLEKDEEPKGAHA